MVLLLDCPTYLGAWDRLKKTGGGLLLSVNKFNKYKYHMRVLGVLG